MDEEEARNTMTSLAQAPATSIPKISEREFNKLNAAKQEQYVRAHWQGDNITPTRDQLFKPEDKKPTLVLAEQEVARGKAKESAANSLVKKLLATEKQLQATAKGESLVLENSTKLQNPKEEILPIYSENTIDTYLVDKSTLIVKASENITVPLSSTKSYQTSITFDVPKGYLLEVSSIKLENPKETTQGIAEKEVMAVLSMRP
ncbi:hypothetical protein CONCODRAFT_13895 [Conidiobolus coronatus NRRL 28638]|uniref:Uncharacterized protein n=1 Tax=Conidiobolus coronatus (strain ATCC 28846 / CBS 209.66 / NRRL 28638) TaxID=796925 RepID=A0A137NPY7_CONC2|nr:hypothetical protein CONCODRAFT_13895 [Conidiobolus coronatus NRRL 28638]|eukprot:KXN64806.1 hypothetical protein CONCODRAFT_13895 [Conidiobolus coronatus NRRL 28638]